MANSLCEAQHYTSSGDVSEIGSVQQSSPSPPSTYPDSPMADIYRSPSPSITDPDPPQYNDDDSETGKDSIAYF